MKRFLSLVSLLLALRCAPALGAPDPTIYDTKALDPALSLQICDMVEEVKHINGSPVIVRTLTPSALRLHEVDIELVGKKLANEVAVLLLLEDKTTPFNTRVGVELSRKTAVRVGDEIIPSVGVATCADGSLMLDFRHPTPTMLAVLRGETPGAPSPHISLSLAPSPRPNQFVLTLTNDGTQSQTLVCGDDGNDNNPRRDPMLNLFAVYQGANYMGNNFNLPLGGLKQPFVLSPGESRSRLVAVADYIALNGAGSCDITAHYTLQVKNADPTKGPLYWGVGLDAETNVSIVR